MTETKREEIIESLIEIGEYTRDEIEEADGHECTYCDNHIPFPGVPEDHDSDCKKFKLRDMPVGLGNSDDTQPADMQTDRGIAGEMNQLHD